MSDFFDVFTGNYAENDEIVCAFVNGLYDVNTVVHDYDLLFNQVSIQ